MQTNRLSFENNKKKTIKNAYFAHKARFAAKWWRILLITLTIDCLSSREIADRVDCIAAETKSIANRRAYE